MARPKTIVSVEKMPTNIFRKLDIAVDLNVVTAQSRATTPNSASEKFISIAGCTNANRPNSATQMLNSFMGVFHQRRWRPDPQDKAIEFVSRDRMRDQQIRGQRTILCSRGWAGGSNRLRGRVPP